MTHGTPINQSIHPRAWRGGHKKNTAAPLANRNGCQGSKTLRKAKKRLAARQRDYDATVQRLGAGHASGYRRPGSMQP